MHHHFRRFSFLLAVVAWVVATGSTKPVCAANPIITDVFTADPAAMVYNGTVYLYTGHDEPPDGRNNYVMHNWLCFSSTDMVHWKPEGSPLAVKEFKWARDDAWAGQVIERGGNFYWYAPVNTAHGFAIGVAVSKSPTGPFEDAIGAPLVTWDMCKENKIGWGIIDPTVYIDDDGQAYLWWGNTNCWYAKLKPNMKELDGPVQNITANLPRYTEAPWVHKHDGLYYLSYASEFPEKIVYATADKITGPWTYRGIINELAGNCNTNHQAIIDFKGKSYFIYHNGGANEHGGSFRRSVCVDALYYNPDRTIKRVIMTTEGVAPAN